MKISKKGQISLLGKVLITIAVVVVLFFAIKYMPGLLASMRRSADCGSITNTECFAGSTCPPGSSLTKLATGCESGQVCCFRLNPQTANDEDVVEFWLDIDGPQDVQITASTGTTREVPKEGAHVLKARIRNPEELKFCEIVVVGGQSSGKKECAGTTTVDLPISSTPTLTPKNYIVYVNVYAATGDDVQETISATIPVV